jgi:hypothetical protein
VFGVFKSEVKNTSGTAITIAIETSGGSVLRHCDAGTRLATKRLRILFVTLPIDHLPYDNEATTTAHHPKFVVEAGLGADSAGTDASSRIVIPETTY